MLINASSTLVEFFEKLPNQNLHNVKEGFGYTGNPWKCDPSRYIPYLPKCGQACPVPRIDSVLFTFPHFSVDPNTLAFDIFVKGCGFLIPKGAWCPSAASSIVVGNTVCRCSSDFSAPSSLCTYMWGYNEIRIVLVVENFFNLTVALKSESSTFTFPTAYNTNRAPNVSDYSEFMKSWKGQATIPSTSSSSRAPTKAPTLKDSTSSPSASTNASTTSPSISKESIPTSSEGSSPSSNESSVLIYALSGSLGTAFGIGALTLYIRKRRKTRNTGAFNSAYTAAF
jgi:hypothetical protein